MIIPGFIISILTFPGIIVHEFGHKLFCNISKVKVHKVCYFRFGNPAGYVVHDKPSKFSQTFFITVAPFIINSLAAILVFALANMFGGNKLLLWLGISIGMHAFPSSGDAKSLWSESNRHVKNNFLAIIGYPFAIFIWIASILSVAWFDLIYAIALWMLF